MKKTWWFFFIIILVVIVVGFILMPKGEQKEQESSKLQIVTSFYPIYIMTANITQGAQNVEVTNLTQNNVGCLHDYTLTTENMKRLEKANIFIENGLGLESFTTQVVQAYSNLKIIDSSQKVTNKIQEGEGFNPHIWTSLENYIKQAEEIFGKLCEYNPENEQIYKANYQSYFKQLNDLKEQYSEQLQQLNSQKVICLNESLTYLAQELKMEVTQITTDHEESTLSAEMMKSIIEKMKKENIKIILVGAQDDLKNAQTLANETGAKIIALEDGMTGDGSHNSYINIMKQNLEILKQIVL